MHLPTVRIKHSQHPDGVVINEDDFDEEQHELHSENPRRPAVEDGADPAAEKRLTVAEMRAELTARGIEFPEGAKKAELRELLEG